MSEHSWSSNCLIFSLLIGETLYLPVSTMLPGVSRSTAILSSMVVSLRGKQVLGLATGALAADVGFIIICAATQWGTHYPHYPQAVVQMAFTLHVGEGRAADRAAVARCVVWALLCVGAWKGVLGGEMYLLQNVSSPPTVTCLFTRGYRAITPAETASTFLCTAGEIREDEQGGILP